MFHKQILLFASLLLFIAAQNSIAHAKGTKFPLPDGTVGLYVLGPNASGDVAGTYGTGGRHQHSYGFLRRADGTFITIDVTKSYRHKTIAEAIDGADDVVGQYEGKDRAQHGFLRTPDGTITTFDAPHAFETLPFDINARAGAMVGWYFKLHGTIIHSFMRSTAGAFTIIDYPAATSTFAYSINALGQITGYYANGAGVFHGFLREPDGTFESIDPPGSVSTTNLVINDKGQITGNYSDSSGVHFGFLRDHGNFYSLDRYFSRFNAHNQAVTTDLFFRVTFRQGGFRVKPVNAPEGCAGAYLGGVNDSGLMSGAMQCDAGIWFGYLTGR